LFTLLDGNSRFEIDTSSQAMAYEWWVDGVQHLKELSNWWRISSIGNANISPQPESSVHLLNPIFQQQTSPNTMTVVYEDTDPSPRFSIQIDFTLSGGTLGSGLGSFGECITITNLTTEELGFHIFEYVDLDLDTTPGDDILQIIDPSAASNPNRLVQTDSTSGTSFTGTFEADRHEIDFFNATLAKLTDNSQSNLASTIGQWPAGAGPIGAGDVTWALQWNFIDSNPLRPRIGPGQTAVICKGCELQSATGSIPEPGGFLLLTASGVALIARRRQRGPVRFSNP
jgi:hypothetical protein